MNLAHEITLYSTVVKLVAMQDGQLPATQGRLAHAAFLDIIHSVDPSLADALHASHGRKPFTVSPLRGLSRQGDGHMAVRQGGEAWLRFTLLGSQLFTTFTRRFLLPAPGRGGAGVGVRIGGVDFAVAEVLTTPGGHPWAGYTTLRTLGAAWENRKLDTEARTIAIRFDSPTVFSRGTRQGLGKWMEPFPYPALFFGSLAAAWNQASPQLVDKAAVRQYAEETVVVGLYHMRSKMVRYWGQPQIGGLGAVTYLLKDRQREAMIRTLNVLADFAFYSGVGYKTTMGMGQVRREA
jgi:CRISPR-associated endoribonuclease Cas6